MDTIAVHHLLADLERDHGALVRSVNRNVELLEDALHALRHGSPNITDEFLERAIAALKR